MSDPIQISLAIIFGFFLRKITDKLDQWLGFERKKKR